MTLKIDVKFEEKLEHLKNLKIGTLTCGLENDMNNLANFYQSTQKYQNSDFDGILSSKIKKKYMILKFTENLCIRTMKNDAKFEEDFVVSRLS